MLQINLLKNRKAKVDSHITLLQNKSIKLFLKCALYPHFSFYEWDDFQLMNIAEESQIYLEIICGKIETFLTKANLSKRKFASKTLLGESTVRSILSRQATNLELRTMVKLCIMFEMELHELLNKNSKLQISIVNEVSENIVNDKLKIAQSSIGIQITKLAKQKKIGLETLSVLSEDMDYSDTLKYLKGQINLTLLTLLKFSKGLEVPLKTILRFDLLPHT